jgi:hypothetical protein
VQPRARADEGVRRRAVGATQPRCSGGASHELPVPIAVTSAVNALAHAVEALYSPDTNPVIDGIASR